jgi:UTP-glucose-1-phosphate uridylyltransferase
MSEELNDMQEFAIDNQEEIQEKMEAIDPLEELVNHDFSSDTEINLDESYEMIQQLKRINNEAQSNEAENIIQEISGVYIEQEYKEKLDKSISNIKSFIRKYDVNCDEIKNASESEKTRLFAIGSFLNKNIVMLINDLKFSLQLSRSEYKMIETAVSRKLSYDGNDVFNIIELNEKYLKEWRLLEKSLPKQVPSFVVDIDIKNVVMLYHFLQKHTVKGISEEFYIFANVLQKIADTNKLYNAYNVLKQRIDVEFGVWTGAMEEVGANIPEESVDTVKGTVS